MIQKSIFTGFLFLAIVCQVQCQIEVHNTGALISIQQNALVSIDGSYFDESSSPDGLLHLEGVLKISGNIINNGTNAGNTLIFGSTENPPFTGKVIITGSASHIGGTLPSFFPTLELQMLSGSSTILDNDISIGANLQVTSGSLNLNGRNILLGSYSAIQSESATNSIFGSGTIQTTPFAINIGASNPNFAGTGFGFLNSENFIGVTLIRKHDLTPYAVADNLNIIRSYVMTTSTPLGTTDLTLRYFDDELNGLKEKGLAIYVSNDDGVSWRKANTVSHDSLQNIITSSGIAFANQASNIVALAPGNCVLLNKPDVTISSAGANVGSTLDICYHNNLELQVPDDLNNAYSWTGPAAQTSSLNIISRNNIVFADAGAYSVFARNLRGCENVNSVNVKVRAIPAAGFSITPDPAKNAICFGTPLVFQDTSKTSDGSAITTWKFHYDDTGNPTSSAASSTYTHAQSGLRTPTLVVTSAFGCVSAVAARPFNIDNLPVANFNMTSEVCEDINVVFKNTSSYTSNSGPSRLDFTWDFGDGTSNLLTNDDPTDGVPDVATHTFQTFGNFTIKLTSKVAMTKCQSTTTASIQIDPEPIPQFDAIVDGAIITASCPGVIVDFQNQTTVPGGTPVSYLWSLGDGASSTASSLQKQYSTANLYAVKLTATSNKGCVESLSKNITINPQPTGSFTITDQDICPGDAAQFNNNSTIASGSLSFQWSWDDNTFSNDAASVVNHSYASARQYNVKLTRTSDQGCTNSLTRVLHVHPRPVVNFIFENRCEGISVDFFDASAIQSDKIISRFWDFGDGAASNITNAKHLYAGFGTFPVWLILNTDFGCSSQISKTVTIFQKPFFDPGPALVVCQNAFTIDPSSGLNYLPNNSLFEWKNSHDDILSINKQVVVSASDVYSLKITTDPSDGSCTNTLDIPIYLFKPVDLGSDVTVCGQTILDAEFGLLNDLSRAESTQYQWNSTNNFSSTQQTVDVTQSDKYTLTITRTIGNVSCQSTDDIILTVESPIILSLPAQVFGCSGNVVQVDSGVSALTYEWVNADAQVVGNSKVLTTTVPGDLFLHASNIACEATSATTVIVNPLPNLDFSLSKSSLCTNDPLSVHVLTTTEGLTMSSWNFGDGTTSPFNTNVVKGYPIDGNFSITVSATDANKCSTSVAKTLTVHPIPVVDFQIPNACANTMVNITNYSPGGLIYDWDFGDGTISSLFQPSKNFSDDGLKNVKLTVSSSQCSSTAVKTLEIYSLPQLEFGDQITTCGANITLHANNGGSNYRWFDATTQSTLATTEDFLITSNISIGLEIQNSFGCITTDVAPVFLNVPLVVDLGTDRTVCDQVELSPGYFPGGSFVWSNMAVTPTIIVSSSGDYHVDLVDQNGCKASSSASIHVDQTPIINIGNQFLKCEGETLTLVAGVNPSFLYSWSTGDATPEATFTSTGDYSVQITNGVCAASRNFSTVFNPLPDVDFSFEDACATAKVNFTNSTYFSGNGQLSFTWDFGQGTVTNVANPSILFNNPGDYLVKLTATSADNCMNQTSKPLTIFANPHANFLLAEKCSGKNLDMANTTVYDGADVLLYNWNFGNGSIATTRGPKVAYQSGGNYLVSLTASSSHGCSDSKAQLVHIGNTPSLSSWQNEISSCNSIVILNAENAGSKYRWSDDSSSQTLLASKSGIYVVEITSADGCKLTAQTALEFNFTLQSKLTDISEGCGEVRLDPQASAVSYWWSSGETTSTIAAQRDGIYTLQVIDKNLCIGRDTTSVVVHPVPVIDLGKNQQACDGQTIALKAISKIPVVYAWSTGSSAPELTVATSGIYKVKLTSINNCVFEDEVNVQFHSLPVIGLPDEVTACGQVQLDASNEGKKFLWSDGSVTQKIIATRNGLYDVKVIDENNCIGEDHVTVKILPVPSIDLGRDKVLCYGETISMDAGNPGAQYLWSDNSTTRILTIGSKGNFKVNVTNNFGCNSIDSVNIDVRPSLGLELGPDKFLCNQNGITFNAGVNEVSYKWGGTSGFIAITKEFLTTQPGKYWVYIEDHFGCGARDTIQLKSTTQTISAIFLLPSLVGRGDLVQFAMLTEPEPSSIRWTFGDGGYSIEKNPTHRYYEPGNYSAQLSISNGTCSDVEEKLITVINARTETLPTIQLPELIEFANAIVYPNPFHGVLNLSLSLTSPTETWVGVYTMNGILIREAVGSFSERQVQFDMSDQPDGMFFIRILVPNRSKVIKVIKTANY
jgi:PKD repeat protein